MMEKYLRSGLKVHVIQKLDNGLFLVDERGSLQMFGEIELFDKPPTDEYHAEIERLKKNIRALKDEKRLVVIEAREAQKRLEVLKRYEGLEYLEGFLGGNITHYAEKPKYSHPKILRLEETVSKYGQCGQLKLLSLFGDSEGNLTWRVNRYSDGSSCLWTEVVPCTSYEQALEVLREEFETRFADKTVEANRKLMETAEEYGIDAPESYVKRVEGIEEKERQQKLERLRQELAELE